MALKPLKPSKLARNQRNQRNQPIPKPQAPLSQDALDKVKQSAARFVNRAS